jgi:hypothetical protein
LLALAGIQAILQSAGKHRFALIFCNFLIKQKVKI